MKLVFIKVMFLWKKRPHSFIEQSQSFAVLIEKDLSVNKHLALKGLFGLFGMGFMRRLLIVSVRVVTIPEF